MSSGVAIFVIGPAGVGKSSLCSILHEHCSTIGRPTHVFNFDPAAEYFDYPASKDIRELVTVNQIMKDCDLGPNGALVACMEYMMKQELWLNQDLGLFQDEFILVDIPGQIELFINSDILPALVRNFEERDYRVACLYLLDSQYLIGDAVRYFGALLNASAAMLTLAVPHLNVITKMDLIEEHFNLRKNESNHKECDKEVEWGQSLNDIADEMHPLHSFFFPDPKLLHNDILRCKPHQAPLIEALIKLIEDTDLVTFIPFNGSDLMREISVQDLINHIDLVTQYGEHLEPHEPNDFEETPYNLEE